MASWFERHAPLIISFRTVAGKLLRIHSLITIRTAVENLSVRDLPWNAHLVVAMTFTVELDIDNRTVIFINDDKFLNGQRLQ